MRTRAVTGLLRARTRVRGPHRHRPARLAAALAATATAGALLFAAGCSSSGAPATNPLTGEPGNGGHVLAVKIDNVGVAQTQQTGLNSADLVYVIQVEGGLSRYLAIFDSSTAPSKVGPVRSARQTDIPLLEPFGRVGLAYSGAISGLLPDLAAANVQNITPEINASLFSNAGSSPTFITPSQIFSTYPNLAQTKDVGFRFGSAPGGGQPATSVSAKMPAAAFEFTASGQKWLVSVDGRAVTSTGQGRASADNVIIQHVKVVAGKYTDHNAGHPDNEVFSETTGSGSADFYRDGQVWHGQWSKPNNDSPTSYTVSGTIMLLTPGRTWIVLEGS
ncbi:DUF3048 domain-containing protein [Actinospica durhamensis]|uniref:DUF3048 domain-containing protein n=1 Tax=Actinospica durhamensis TaxID=1508375 RepID=A0A941EUG0_9ACTN|nr:DUF3048 domain-containing protein [Actinospica durhamensis]MBR7837216.1 DUF3048 domain-containing protein [Actinospica durhamensis]